MDSETKVIQSLTTQYTIPISILYLPRNINTVYHKHFFGEFNKAEIFYLPLFDDVIKPIINFIVTGKMRISGESACTDIKQMMPYFIGENEIWGKLYKIFSTKYFALQFKRIYCLREQTSFLFDEDNIDKYWPINNLREYMEGIVEFFKKNGVNMNLVVRSPNKYYISIKKSSQKDDKRATINRESYSKMLLLDKIYYKYPNDCGGSEYSGTDVLHKFYQIKMLDGKACSKKESILATVNHIIYKHLYYNYSSESYQDSLDGMLARFKECKIKDCYIVL